MYASSSAVINIIINSIDFLRRITLLSEIFKDLQLSDNVLRLILTVINNKYKFITHL